MRNAATAYRRLTVLISTIVVALVATPLPLSAAVRAAASTSGSSPSTTIPSGLALTGTSATSISLSWKASRPRSAVAGYRLYRDGVLVGSTTNTVATYANLSCGTSYGLGVASFSASGGTSPVATVLASTSACPDTTPPTTPSSLTVAAFDQTSISLNWKPSTDASNSVLYELSQDGTRVVVTAATDWTFDTLKCGMSYTLGVLAYDSAGNRSATATVIAGTAPCSFTVAPSVSITGKPIDGTTATDATFTFSSTGAIQLECRLDGAAFQTCASPKTYSGLAAGTHTFDVRATNAAGSATASASWTISALAPALPPSNASTPTISGTASAGAQLSEGGDTWTGTSPMSYGYQWRRCDSLGANCASIAGATAQTYLLTASDVGKGIRVAVTASNVAGSSTATSTASTVAAPAPAPLPSPVAPPVAPAAYSVPAGAVNVSSSAGLLSALGGSTPTDIVLADGVYDNPAPFVNSFGHRIYAANIGKAVLKAGLVFGNNWGSGNGLVQGVAFDVTDPTKTFQSSIINVWGTGKGSRVLDVTLDGHSVLGAGILVRQAEGFVARRIIARNFVDWGVLVDENSLTATLSTPALLEDLDLANVTHVVPRSSNGTSEACLWIGNSATVRRVRTRNCAWEGVWVGTATKDSLFEDIDVNDAWVGLYLEHFSSNTTFQRMHVGPNIDTGLNCEWANPLWGSVPGCTDNIIQDSVFDTRTVGVNLDDGTIRTTVRRSTFLNQTWAGIGNYRGVNNLYDTTGNDYSRIGPGAVPISTGHSPSA